MEELFTFGAPTVIVITARIANINIIAILVDSKRNFISKEIFFALIAEQVFISKATRANIRAVMNHSHLAFVVVLLAVFTEAVIFVKAMVTDLDTLAVAVEELQNKTLNIVINSFDRIQFIQMLGRIRVNPNDNISLFIRKYSIGELKNQLRRNTELLLKILRNDMLSLFGKQELFDKCYFRYSESPEIFSEYNPCAIYQLIDNVIFLLNTIRLNEPDFFIKFTNDDMRALKTKIYQYYRVGEGKNKPWSRYIFDILETPSGWSKRKENKNNPSALYFSTLNLLRINHENILKSHESSLNDTINNYFSQELELNLPNDLSDPFSVQLQWIGKDLSDVSPIKSFKTCSSHNSEYTETISEKTIKKYCVSERVFKNV